MDGKGRKYKGVTMAPKCLNNSFMLACVHKQRFLCESVERGEEKSREIKILGVMIIMEMVDVIMRLR